MTMTDPTSDLLTRILNGLAVNKRWVDIPSSNMKKRIVYILKEEKYIDDFIYVVKDKIVNTASLLGYYMEAKFKNTSTSKAELFSIGSEFSESSQ